MPAPRTWLLAALLLAVPATVAVACLPPTANGPDASVTASPPDATAAPTSSPTTPVSSEPTTAPGSDGEQPPFTCALPAPVKSQDACATDADCGPSDPCHARACVARSKSRPPDKSTICTQIMDCKSIDANPCVCFEGVCALVPPPPDKQ